MMKFQEDKMNKTGGKTKNKSVALLLIFFLLLAGCKDLFHPEGPKEDRSPPSAPSELSADTESSSSIRVSWNSVSGANGYDVYRATSSEGAYSPIITSINSTFYTDTGLSSNSVYYYRVSAYNYYGYSSQSYYVSASTGGAALSAPTSVDTLAQASSSISINWSAVSGASGYYVYRAPGANGTFSRIATVNDISYTDTGLKPNTAYYYRVSAYNSYGEGSQSGYVFVVTGRETLMPNISLQSSLDWLDSNAQEGGAYTISLQNDETIEPRNLSYGGKNLNITIVGETMERTVSLSSTGSIFTVESGVTLTLDNNVTLLGRSDNTASLIIVNSGGNLIMNGGAKITGNTASNPGGGVLVYESFTMNGGAITNNTTNNFYGGGVYCHGDFTMNGGIISGNTATNSDPNPLITNGGGGGVCASGGYFLMTGGIISANTSVWGSGVLISSGNNIEILGAFLKTGGIIYGSDATDGLKNASGAAVEIEGALYNNSNELVANPVPTKRRFSTADVGVILDSSLVGATGGWEDGLSYTVAFDADGGSPAIQTKTVASGDSVGTSNMPSEPTRTGYAFDGWHTVTNGGGAEFTGATTVEEPITVYAKWVAQHTVTFHADGGNPNTQTLMVNSGDSVRDSIMPLEPNKSGYVFDGWHTLTGGGGTEFTGATVVTENVTVYAKWKVSLMPTTSLQAALDWLDLNAVEGGEYVIMLSAIETIAPRTLSYDGKKIRITIKGDDTKGTVMLNANGSLFTVCSGITMILDNNITLQGRSDNTASLVTVNSGGTLVMNTGSKIIGNSKNTDNINYGGGGVFVYGGTFAMSGGTISGNSASASYYGGGGVHVWSGTFTMSGGTISGNTTSFRGGGVCIGNSSATFSMTGGTISGNSVTATAANAASHGGGVYVTTGAFIMSSGVISGNSAYYGGGVYVRGAFDKQSGGIIYGSDANGVLKNTATSGDDYGHAIYVDTTPNEKRNTTAGTGITLDSATHGAAGGWE
jgi:uncharacterized repeat protein (TIGR02543 family)